MVAGTAMLAARDGVGEREEQGGLIYMRARVTAGDDGEVSAVLRQLNRRAYGRRRGRTGGPLRARCEYGGVAVRFEASWGRASIGGAWTSGSARPLSGSRREGARVTAAEGRPATRGARAHDVAARWRLT
jgi:hypothetical protein